MNVQELDTLTLQYIRQPAEDVLRRKYAQMFLASYNELYRRIMRDIYKPTHRETVDMDTYTLAYWGIIDTSNLTMTALKIEEVRTTGNIRYTKVDRYTTEKIMVPNPSGSQAVVIYQYMPPLLVNDSPESHIDEDQEDETNTPVFPEAHHLILSMHAASLQLQTEGKLNEAGFWKARVDEMIPDIKPVSINPGRLWVNCEV